MRCERVWADSDASDASAEEASSDVPAAIGVLAAELSESVELDAEADSPAADELAPVDDEESLGSELVELAELDESAADESAED